MLMKIATWNIERPTSTSKRLPSIIQRLKDVDADILILTETNDTIDLGEVYTTFHTSELKETFYKAGEKRVSIYSKYKSNEQLKTFREDTSLCVILQTPLGDLAVYGTIIGTNGSKGHNFTDDLALQLIDFDNIAANYNLCIAGDLNITFGDNYYYTKDGRDKLNSSFTKLNLVNLTSGIQNNIDHIVITKSFIGERAHQVENPWNNPPDSKIYSDHQGVAVSIDSVS